jgi:fatty acid desaturase
MGMEAAVHELSHGTVFRTRWLNEFFYRIFAFLTWNSYLHFKESHRRHHQFTYFRGLDREQQSDPIAVRWFHVVSWFTIDYMKIRKLLWTNLNHAVGNTDVDFFFWCPLLSREDIKTRKLISWARIMIVGHILLAALFIWQGLWILLLLVTFAPFCATFLSHATGILQHAGMQGDVPDWRVNSHVVRLGPVMGYLYWHMNYHTDHHMYASVPFYNLRRLHKEIEWDLPKPLPGLLSGVRHVIRVRKKQESDPDYRWVPEFPEGATPPSAARNPSTIALAASSSEAVTL